jgi:hypothetical protein
MRVNPRRIPRCCSGKGVEETAADAVRLGRNERRKRMDATAPFYTEFYLSSR